MSSTLLPNIPVTELEPAGPASGTSLNPNFITADNVNGNYFVASGRDLVEVYNSDTVPHNLTVTSAPDVTGRTDTINYVVPSWGFTGSPPTVPTYGYVSFVVLPSSIFTQTDGTVQLSADSPLVFFLIRSL